ncbi:hypothetical protein PDJ90_24415, partial [Bacillus cereus]|nr:hypothetical protein [Bacillus cereus]
IPEPITPDPRTAAFLIWNIQFSPYSFIYFDTKNFLNTKLEFSVFIPMKINYNKVNKCLTSPNSCTYG